MLNITAASKTLGVNPVQVRKWIGMGAPVHQTENGERVVVAELFDWYTNNLAGITEDERAMTKVEAQRRRAVADALTSELALAEKRGEVAPIDLQLSEFTAALSGVRASLMSMPARLAGLLSHQDDETVSKILDKDISETLNHLSGYQHE